MTTEEVLIAERMYLHLAFFDGLLSCQYAAAEPPADGLRAELHAIRRVSAILSTRYSHVSKKIPSNYDVIQETPLDKPCPRRDNQKYTGPTLGLDTSETGGL